jgi:hypothetical protein
MFITVLVDSESRTGFSIGRQVDYCQDCRSAQRRKKAGRGLNRPAVAGAETKKRCRSSA